MAARQPGSPASERIGFLGLGIMGSRMAANIARAGYPLSVWTHTAGKAESWAAGHGAQRVRDAGRGGGAQRHRREHGRGRRAGGGGAARARAACSRRRREGLLCVDMSTIGPPQARAIGAASGASAACSMLDAPVTGSSPRAEDGTLTIMVGGEAEEFTRAQPLLEAMGELIVHVGELGQGADAEADQQLARRRQRGGGRRGAAARRAPPGSSWTPSCRSWAPARAPPPSCS